MKAAQIIKTSEMPLFTYVDNCLDCGVIIKQTNRPQGGGSRKIFCSHNCAAKDWVKRNRSSRQRSVILYESKPENKEKKKQKQRKRKFKDKYDLTEEQVLDQLSRQKYKCLGCSKILDINSARVDHCHNTGKFRGILCNTCNWCLGHAKDSKEILYRLASYLTYNREKRLIYIVGSLRNPKILKISNKIRELGYDVFDDYMAAGPEADDYWQKYETQKGHDYIQALKGRAAEHVFFYDKSFLDLADAIILVMPAGKSCHLEAGYMAGLDKPVYILLDKAPDRFDIMPNFATKVCFNLDELLEVLKSV